MSIYKTTKCEKNREFGGQQAKVPNLSSLQEAKIRLKNKFRKGKVDRLSIAIEVPPHIKLLQRVHRGGREFKDKLGMGI